MTATTITCRVNAEQRFTGPRSYTSFHADGVQVTVDTPALTMALNLSGVQLHHDMSPQDIAWACVAGIRAVGGPAMLAHADETSRQVVLAHIDNDTDWRTDPAYLRCWQSEQRHSLCTSLIHLRLLRDIPVGRDIGTPIGTYSSSAAVRAVA